MSKTIEILKFLRVTPEKKRLIQVRGKVYTNVDEIPDDRVKQIVRQSIAEMVTMAGGYDRLVDEGLLKPVEKAPEPQPLEDSDLGQLVEEDRIAQSEAEPAAVKKPVSPQIDFGAQNQSEFADSPSAKSKNGSLLNRFRNLTGRQPEKPQSSILHLDIAGQINEFLQAKVVENQSFIGRQVELRSAIGGDLQFVVDGRFYESVNEIPDESAANLFRSAIAEWESR